MKISIEYCSVWNYLPKASSLEEHLKAKYNGADIKLISSGGGVFEITLENKLILSTHNLDPASVKNYLGDQIPSESLRNILDLLKACDAGKYAPGGMEREATILRDMAAVMKQIDRNLAWDTFYLS